MKYIWEEQDIRPGHFVCKPNSKDDKPQVNGLPQSFEPSGWTAKWTYLIGYVNGDSRGKYVLISLQDGMTSHPKSAAEAVEYLNKQGLIPMPHDWLVKTVDYLRDRRW